MCLDKFTVRCYVTGPTARGSLDFGRILSGKILELRLADWAFYAVDYVANASNNSFILTVAGTPYAMSVPIGNYNASGLISALNTVMAGVLPGSSATYNITTNTVTIAHSAAFTLTVASGASNLYGLASTTVTATSVTGPYQILSQNSLFYGLRIDSNPLIGYDPRSFNWCIVNNGGPGGLIARGSVVSQGMTKITNGVLSAINFELLDQYGLPLNIGAETMMFAFDVTVLPVEPVPFL